MLRNKSGTIVWLVLLCMLVGCQKKDSAPIHRIPNLVSDKEEISIRNWQLLGPFFADYSEKYNKWEPIDYNHFAQWNSTEKDMDAAKFYAIGEHDTMKFLADTLCLKNLSLSAAYNPIAVHEELSSTMIGNSYAACILNSEADQDVAFLLGSDDGVRVWVNQELCYKVGKGGRAVERNSNIFKVHLKRGENFVLLKLNNSWYGEGYFSLNVSSLSHAKESIYAYQVQADFLVNPVISSKDSLALDINPDFVDLQGATVQIISPQGKKVLEKRMDCEGSCTILRAGQLSQGVYRCRLLTNTDTLEQRFIAGNYKAILGELEAKITPFLMTGETKLNSQVVVNRIRYLEDFGRKNKFEKSLYQKMTNLIYELAVIAVALEEKKDAFTHVPGLHLRGFVSGIDGHTENYMVYIPDSYTPNKPLPLVVVIPWIGGTRQPFTESMHMAEQDKIDLFCQLAKAHGFGVLWTSSRIYEQYNLNPLVNAATFETLDALKKDYVIDTNRLYAFGSCSGGLFTLLLANRYPGLFAAVGVEGPAITYLDNNCSYAGECPEPWLSDNNMLSHLENFSNFSTYIAQARHDKKTDFALVRKLALAIETTGGKVVLDSIENAMRDVTYDFYPREKVLTDIFDFFSKTVTKQTEASLSTSQLKYNRARWLTVNQLNGKALIRARMTDSHTIVVTCQNVGEYTIDLPSLPIDKSGKLKVVTNGKTLYVDSLTYKTSVKVRIGESLLASGKNHQTEGPVNDFFTSGFVVVQGTLGNETDRKASKLLAEKFVTDWKDHYFGTCRVKRDMDINASDIDRYHLVLIGNSTTNWVWQQITNKLPLKTDQGSVTIGKSKVSGKSLNYTMIYPNPLNKGKYVLVIGCNNGLYTDMQAVLPYQGWFDYEIYSKEGDHRSERGNFDKNWQ